MHSSEVIKSVPLYRLAAMLVAVSFMAIGLAACARTGPATKPADVDYYTCTMHPSVRSQDPNGKCPICGMNLVPVFKSTEPSPGTNPVPRAEQPRENALVESTREFRIPLERQQLIGVTYGKVQRRPFKLSIPAVGVVTYDQQRHWDYVTRVDGYIEKLFVSSAGESVEPGQPLLTIYSPQLLTAENEFLVALKARDQTGNKADPLVRDNAQQLAAVARRRLELWDISDEQIDDLERTRTAPETLTLKSPFRGVVQQLAAVQGRRVGSGDRLVAIDDLSQVWVWAQFYETELAGLKKGLPVTVSVPAYPDETFTAKIALLDPFLDPVLRTARARIDVDNPSFKLRPEMFANVEVKVKMGEGLSVPVAAVLPTGRHNIAFVDKGEGKLEPRLLELGRKYGDIYEVRSGLKEGEQVVTSANFLIDAEAKVQGALPAW